MAAARIKTVAMVLIRPDKEGEKVTMLEKDINPKPEAIKKMNFLSRIFMKEDIIYHKIRIVTERNC